MGDGSESRNPLKSSPQGKTTNREPEEPNRRATVRGNEPGSSAANDQWQTQSVLRLVYRRWDRVLVLVWVPGAIIGTSPGGWAEPVARPLCGSRSAPARECCAGSPCPGPRSGADQQPKPRQLDLRTCVYSRYAVWETTVLQRFWLCSGYLDSGRTEQWRTGRLGKRRAASFRVSRGEGLNLGSQRTILRISKNHGCGQRWWARRMKSPKNQILMVLMIATESHLQDLETHGLAS
jgi:hypothetical protein